MTGDSFRSSVPDDEEPVPDVNTGVPHIARVYDYWLGGKDNFAAGRKVAELALQARPETRTDVRRSAVTRASPASSTASKDWIPASSPYPNGGLVLRTILISPPSCGEESRGNPDATTLYRSNIELRNLSWDYADRGVAVRSLSCGSSWSV
jgi:hypothetical protein